MKKLTSIIMIIVLLTVAVFADIAINSDVAAYSVSEAAFYNMDREELDKLSSGGKMYARAKIANNTEDLISVGMFVAVYDDGQLIDIRVQNAEFPAGSYVYLSNFYSPVTVPEAYENCVVKMIMVEGFENIMPISACAYIDANGVGPTPTPTPTATPTPIPTEEPTATPEVMSYTLFDNFSTITNVETCMLATKLYSGALFSSVDGLCLRADRKAYGNTKYEGTNPNIVEGYWDGNGVDEMHIAYEGLYGGQTLRVAFSAQKHVYETAYKAVRGTNNVQYGDWEVLKEYYFGDNLHVYAGPNSYNLTEVDIKSWEGDSCDNTGGDTNEDKITFIAAITESLPANTSYVKIAVDKVFYWPFRILSVKIDSADQINVDKNPTTSPVPTATATPEPSYAEGDYSWINPNNYTNGKICVVQPTTTSTITKDTTVYICARGFTSVAAKCWNDDGTKYGSDTLVANVALDNYGRGSFVFPATEYPHGPVTIRISGRNSNGANDEFNLQLYNEAGQSWNEGLANEPIPPQAQAAGLKLMFADDFTSNTLKITYDGHDATYASHKIGYQDFSGLGFENHEIWNTGAPNPKSPFSQVDTYLRIRADASKNSTGLISSSRHDFTGNVTKIPAYFECKFIAQNATGTWPAFWTLTQERGYGSDELDIIEAYGFDKSSSNHDSWGAIGYNATFHDWGNKASWDNSSNDHAFVDQSKIGGGGAWWQNFHTYGCLITDTDTVYYMDNIEVFRHKTLPLSKTEPHYFLINFAIGGISGWPIDLSRYGGVVDMYVDWVRVYNATGVSCNP